MAYSQQDAYKTMQKILGLKQDWANADAAGDATRKNNAATKAQEYYASLRDNGYGAQAQQLQSSGLDQSRKYIDNFYAMSGRQQTRPYFYGKGQKYGLSQSDIDKALSFNETTGEVSLGGKNIGRPAAISSDGYSYYDSGTLDKAWEDYVKTTGATENMGNIAKQGTSDLMSMNKQLFDTTMKDHDTINGTNPLESDIGRAVMQKYGLMGYTGRQNALANGAASNGGNVDSYSAANAMRQQAALNSMGVDAALNAYNTQQQTAGTRLDQARATLQQMGVNINDAVANNETMLNGEVDRSETVKNGQVDRDVKTAAVTGTIPKNMDYSNNPFFDNDGRLINPTQDYAEIIENAQAKLKTTTNPQEIADLEETIRNARQARVAKVYGNYGDYSQYANTLVTPSARQTEDARQFDKQIDNSVTLAGMGYQQEKDMANLNADIASKQAQQDAKLQMQVDNNTTNNTIRANTAAAQDEVNAYNATGGKIGGTGKTSSSSTTGTDDNKMTKDFEDSLVETINRNVGKYTKQTAIKPDASGKYKLSQNIKTNYPGWASYIVAMVYNDEGITEEQANEWLNSIGLTDDEIAKYLQ